MTALRFFASRAVASFDQMESGLHDMLDVVPIDELQALIKSLEADPGLEALAGASLARREAVRYLAGYGLAVIALKRDEDGRWAPPLAPGSGAVLDGSAEL